MERMSSPWESALPWLLDENHATTAAETAQLKAYCDEHPRHMDKKNNDGRLSLHCAARNQRGVHSAPAVSALITVCPLGVQEKTNTGHLPLHAAAQHQKGQYGAAAIALLLTAYPDGIRVKTTKGSLPLHVAVQGREERRA